MTIVNQEEFELAIQVVRQLWREERLSPEQLEAGLDEYGLQLLKQSGRTQGELRLGTYERLLRLIESADPKELHLQGPVNPRLVGASTDAMLEVLEIDLLLMTSDAQNAHFLIDCLDQSHDTRFHITQVATIDELAEAVRLKPHDLALLDLTSSGFPGIAALARPEIVELPVPSVPILDRDEESQALHMGLRDHLVKQEINARLVIRTLRSVQESQRLTADLQDSRDREHFHATRDSMTGIPNRYHFREELAKEIAQATRAGTQIWVLYLDLDRFKTINDSLGHATGDQLLLTVAARLSAHVRATDLVARVGGDEFLLMLRGSTLGVSPQQIATKLIEAIASPVKIGSNTINTSASVGISSFPDDGTDADTLVRNADQALYQAKAKGRNNYQFYSYAQDAAAARRFAVETKLRAAIARDELDVYYQPRVEVDNQRGARIIGSEAVLRWFDPELGEVSPNEFIVIAEETGLITSLGEWVMRRACEQQRRWIDAGHKDLRISINVSARQIREATLRASILRILWDTGLKPGSIEIEITESAFIDQPEVATRVFQELSTIGLGLALDDFGTGYSSLSYLKRFPVDTIKIDQSFVLDATVDPDDASIVEAILSIGEKLGLKVVAEGVESERLRDFLTARGCTEMQGFLWSPPVPPEQLTEMLEEGGRL